MLLFNHCSFLGARFVLSLALLAGLFGVVPVSRVYAATLIVPDNYRTIQAAINAAISGDTIIVRVGTYSENLTINKSVILTAASFDAGDPTRNTTIINAKSSTKPAILISAGVSPMPTIRGFIIRNGLDNIAVASEAIIEHNYFIGSTDQLDYRAGGGGVTHHNVFFASQDDAIDLDNMNRPLLIENNRLMYSRDDGIEVRLHDATAPAQPITITIRNNEIIGCDEDGIQFIDYGQTVNTNRNFMVTGNVIANCRFAGIGLMGNTISVENYSGADIIEAIWVYNNTIYGNDYGISGGDNLVAHNNIVANSLTKGVWRVQGPAGASAVVAYSLFYNNGVDADQSTLGAGNKFGQNPLFASVPNPGPDGVWRTVDDDFRGLALQFGSPAIDAAYDPSCPSVDLRGVARPQGVHCDLGAFEGATAAIPGPKPPIAASLVSPAGNIYDNTQPTYVWNAVLNSGQGDAATWYLISLKRSNNTVVFSQWYEASKICTGNSCSIRPSTALTNGVYSWEVQTWNNIGYGPWSTPLSFIVGFLPGEASPLSPAGTITDTTPTFFWNASPDTTTTDPATWYYLYVSGPSGYVFTQWYDASKICSSGTCSVANAATIIGGAYTWWVQTWNAAGDGPWSTGMSFNTPPPGKATLVSPNGSISTNNPIYTWNQVSEATRYYLYVSGPSGYVFANWYAASDICGASTCSVANATTLGSGAHTWWVQTWNEAGYGPWSTGISFSPALPGATTLVSPSGTTADHTPLYTWSTVSGATWYYLYVDGPSGNVIQTWYRAIDICGPSTCSVADPTILGSGTHRWWVQTWNGAGYGPWSTGVNFTVSL